jgi:hypothetical protein
MTVRCFGDGYTEVVVKILHRGELRYRIHVASRDDGDEGYENFNLCIFLVVNYL